MEYYAWGGHIECIDVIYDGEYFVKEVESAAPTDNPSTGSPIVWMDHLS